MSLPRRLLSVLFITTGMLHFLRPRTSERAMPGYLPAHRELVLLSGAAELAGGVGLVFARTRRGAGFWLAAVLAAIFPANVHMALHARAYRPLPPALLWARLPLQPLLILWALRTARRES